MSMLKNNHLEIKKRKNGTRSVKLVNFEKTRTQQHTKDQCDINHIMKKFQKTGQLPLIQRTPFYDDFSNPQDYKQSVEILMKASQQFDNLPSNVRKRFNNNPAKFLEFVNDEKNLNEMRELGIAEKEQIIEPEAPIEVIITNPEKKDGEK